jgi:hypothetical protein
MLYKFESDEKFGFYPHKEYGFYIPFTCILLSAQQNTQKLNYRYGIHLIQTKNTI